MTNKNIIYTINYKPTQGGIGRGEGNKDFLPENCEWMDYALSSIKKYAVSVGADLTVLTEKDAERINLPGGRFTHFQVANFLKFITLNDFCESDYDKLLFLDIDYLIDKFDYNIFKECESLPFCIREGGNKAMLEKHKIILKDKFKIDAGEKHFYCWGCFLTDKSTAISICKNLPKDKQWESFFTKNNLISNSKMIINGESKLVSESDIFASCVAKENIKCYDFPDPFRNIGFTHFPGVRGKERLREIISQRTNGH